MDEDKERKLKEVRRKQRIIMKQRKARLRSTLPLFARIDPFGVATAAIRRAFLFKRKNQRHESE